MAILVGVVLALSVGLFASVVGLDRERSFYPTVTIVIALTYALFAVMGGAMQVLLIELLVIAVFVGAAVAGFKRSLWIVVAALAGHGIFDFFHAGLITNPGVPLWWPNFCLSYDVVAAAYLAVLLRKSRVQAATS